MGTSHQDIKMARQALIVMACIATLLTVCSVEAKRRCPSVNPFSVGICVHSCSTDSDCGKGLLCCRNGCGTVCSKGVEDSSVEGRCPKSSGMAGICVFRPGINCVSDNECASKGQLCCSEGCG